MVLWTLLSLVMVTLAILYNIENKWTARNMMSPFLVSNASLISAWAVCCPIMGLKSVWYCNLNRRHDDEEFRKGKRVIKKCGCIAIKWGQSEKEIIIKPRKPISSPAPAVNKIDRGAALGLSAGLSSRLTKGNAESDAEAPPPPPLSKPRSKSPTGAPKKQSLFAKANITGAGTPRQSTNSVAAPVLSKPAGGTTGFSAKLAAGKKAAADKRNTQRV